MKRRGTEKGVEAKEVGKEKEEEKKTGGGSRG